MQLRILVSLLTVFILSMNSVNAQKPKIVNEDYIYVNADGTQSFPGSFYIAEKFSGNFAAVANISNGIIKWAYINKSGHLITEYTYDDAQPFKSNTAIVRINNCLGMIDSAGRLFIPAEYKTLTEFQNGFAICSECSRPENFGYLRSDGSPLLSFSVSKAFPFENNIAKIMKPDSGGKRLNVAFIDTSGQIVGNRWFLTAGNFFGDSCKVTTQEGYFWFHTDGRMNKFTFEPGSEKCEEIFTIVEDPPSFPGGEEALNDYLSANIKYPELARVSGIQGTVFVTFTVTRSGSVTDAKILRGIGGGCDEESIRVIRNMPSWNPGLQRGKPVCVQYNLPIRFRLDDDEKKKE